MSLSPRAPRVSSSNFNIALWGKSLVLLVAIGTGAAACDSVPAPPPRPYAEQFVMPNGSGFYEGADGFGLQGAWYWYDDVSSNIDRVEVKVDKDVIADTGDDSEGDFIWLNTEDPTSQDFSNRSAQVLEICVSGNPDEYMALGFELCSSRSDQTPAEFPNTLGNCSLPSATDVVDRFRGVRFDINLSVREFKRIEVEFKEWALDDELTGRCVVYGENEEVNNNAVPCKYELVDGNPSMIRVTAEALKAASVAPKSQVYRTNPAMLQAIHIVVYNKTNTTGVDTASDRDTQAEDATEPDTEGDDKPPFLRFCISKVYALGLDKPQDTDTDNVDEARNVPIREGGDTVSVKPLDDTDTEWSVLDSDWIEIENDGDAGPFEIMQKEVTVHQYGLCQDRQACSPITPNWESCLASDSGAAAHIHNQDTVWSERAVNCVNWYQAKEFCAWLGGDLPSSAQWTSVNVPFPTPCVDTVAIDEKYGVGCGVRIPEAGCLGGMKTDRKVDSDSSSASPKVVCDLYGNLWEWVTDDITKFDRDQFSWADGYKRLFGGSLNTIKFSKDYATFEHPLKPHSPTRLGFRCVRPLESSNSSVDAGL